MTGAQRTALSLNHYQPNNEVVTPLSQELRDLHIVCKKLSNVATLSIKLQHMYHIGRTATRCHQHTAD